MKGSSLRLRLLWPVAVACLVLAAGATLSGPQAGQKGAAVDIPKDVLASPYGPTPKLSPPEPGVVRGAMVQRDLATGRVVRVRGEVPMAGARTPEEAAVRFLRTNAKVLELSSDLRELQPLESRQSLTGTHVRFRQVLAGYPVLGGYLSVHLNKKGAVVLVNADLVTIKGELKTAISGDPAKAIAQALEALKPQAPPTVPPTASPAVFVQDAQPVLVWNVHVDTRKPAGAWEVLVSIPENKVLRIVNRARFVDGDGWVFLPNPVMTSGQANLTDNDDADYPALNNERVQVTLKDLDGTGFLQGPFCTTEPTAQQPRANEPSFSFNYLRSDDRFEEVMCYYHIDTNQRYIQGLGFTNVNNRPQGMDVNGTTDDNAWYSPWTGNITMGTGGVDDAEDAHVILHEYGHAIQDNQVPGWGQTHEGGSMGEGFGDYWAVTTFTGIGPHGHDWDVYVATWDATSYNPGNPAFLRRLDSTKHYPEDMQGEVHADGEIWSACLWQIRGIVGQTRADTIILESHFRLSPLASFQDGALAIIAANQDLYGGADGQAITQVFVDRGILIDPRITNLSVAHGVAYPGQDVTLKATLTRALDGAPVAGKTITFTVDGSDAGSAVTDADGVASVPFTVPADAQPGEIIITADWAGDEEAFPATSSAKIYVLQQFSISGSVTDSGAPMEGVTVTGTLAGVSASLAPNLSIPDGDPTGVESVTEIKNSGTVGSVEVSVNIQHTWIGDLKVGLVHPDGTMILLHDMTGGSAHNIVTTYPTLTTPAESLDKLRGKPLAGPWRLWVSDNAALDTGRLVSWTLKVYRETPLTVTATTASDGTYALAGLEPGTWRVVPSRGTSAFAPTHRDVTVGPDQVGVNFALNSFTIAGTVRHGSSGLPDVTVTLTSPADKNLSMEDWPGTAIPDNNTTGIEAPLTVTDGGTVTDIHVWVAITHPYIGDLEVSLIHPDGTRVRLHNRTGGSADNIYTTYPDETRPAEPLSALFGKPVQGTWKLRIRDLAIADTGTLDGWGLSLSYIGTVDRTTTTDADGKYSFADCLAGTHLVRPSKPGHPFTPDVATVVVGPHRYDVDFLSLAKATALVVSPATGAIDSSATLSATLTETDSGAPVAGMTVDFAVDGTPVGSGTTDASGVASVTYSIPPSVHVGDLTVDATFAGSVPYMGSTASGTLSVAKGAVRVFGLDRSGVIGETVDLRGYVRTLNSQTPLEGKTVTFSVNGTDVGQADTDASGRASLPYVVPGPVGTVPLGFSFAGDADFQSGSGSATLTATTSGSKMSLPDRTGTIGGDVYLKAYLWSNPGSKPLANKAVSFAVDGTDVGTAPTNASGRALLRYWIPDGTGAGTRSLSAAFAGDAGYGPSSASASLTVGRAPVYIWPYARSVRQGQPAVLRAYVRRLPDYQWLTHKTIAFQIEGTDVGTADTDETGIAWFTYPDTTGLSVGSHSFTAIFAGDAWIAPGSATGTFKVVAP